MFYNTLADNKNAPNDNEAVSASAYTHILRYRVEDSEQVDDFSFRILSSGEIDGLIPLGRDESDILIPVSDLTPLENYLYSKADPNTVKDILCQAACIFKRADRYMLCNSTILKRLRHSYIKDRKLYLICIPASFAYTETDTEKDYFRSVISASVRGTESADEFIDLLKAVNSESFCTEDFCTEDFCAEFCAKSFYTENADTDSLCTETSVSKKTEKSQKTKKTKGAHRFSLIDFLFPPSPVGDSMSFAELPESTGALSQITVLAVRSTGDEYPLLFGPDIIGTDPSTCSICFPNGKKISREHCRVYLDRGRFYIEDLESINGTYLNNSRLEPGKPKALSPADLIEVGDEQIVFSIRSR